MCCRANLVWLSLREVQDVGNPISEIAVAPLHESSRLKQVYVRPKYT